MEFIATHVITVRRDGLTVYYRVMLVDDRLAYTLREWDRREGPQWECVDGEWRYHGALPVCEECTVERLPPVNVLQTSAPIIREWDELPEQREPKTGDLFTRARVHRDKHKRGNQDSLTRLMQTRCSPHQKAKWERAARRAKKDLSQWVRDLLDEASSR